MARNTTGKHMPNALYVHKSAIDQIPYETFSRAMSYFPGDFSWDVVKHNTKTGAITFTQSPDWNTAPEPTVGDAYHVSTKGDVRFLPQGADPWIYHHKWEFVGAGYDGFDVQASRHRSTLWTLIPGINRSLIGKRSYWNRMVRPLVDLLWADADNEVSAKTCVHLVTRPLLFSRMDFAPYTINVDLGGGRFDDLTEELWERNVQNLVYDSYNRSHQHNADVLARAASRPADSVTLSNLLNVVPDEGKRYAILLLASLVSKMGAEIGVTCYEGNRTGKGATTKSDTWQENRATAAYLEEVRQVFPDAALMPGRWIKATNMGAARK